jgi:hypothetical protein
MFTIDRARELLTLPLLVKIGLVAMAFAGLADVVAHLEGPSDGHLHAHSAGESAAHLAGFVSMVVILLGVVIDGVRKGRVRRTGVAWKESPDAVR